MTALRGYAGWLALLLSLAIPAWMAYNWWSHLNDESKRQMSRKIRRRLPQGEGLFPGSPWREKFINPMAGAAPVVSSGTLRGNNSFSRTAPQQPISRAQSAAAAAAMTADKPALAAPAAAPAEAAVATVLNRSTAAHANASPAPAVKAVERTFIARDPTLSPSDLMGMDQEGASRRPSAGVESRKGRIENAVDLQGIVAVGRRNKAIVNGRMVGEGDSIGQIKVVRITINRVTFAYKDKRFTKVVK